MHTPLGGKPDVIAKYQAKAAKLPDLKQKNATYAALVESVDDSLGTIRAALKRLKLDENTIIVFTSDNGGLIPVTDNSPFRVGKGSAYEGGVRVPLIIHAPGATKAGLVENTPAMTIDIYPTVLELAGVKPLQSLVDGISLAPLLKSGAKPDRAEIFWHYPHYGNQGGAPAAAVRRGDWKLIEWLEDNRVELFNLAADLGEKADVASREPARVASLRAELHAWQRDVGAKFPIPNPAYDPAKPSGRRADRKQ